MFYARRTFAAVGGLILTLYTIVGLAPAASAHRDPPVGGSGTVQSPPPPVTEPATSAGLPLWAALAIAAVAAAIAVCAVLTTSAMRHRHHGHTGRAS